MQAIAVVPGTCRAIGALHILGNLCCAILANITNFTVFSGCLISELAGDTIFTVFSGCLIRELAGCAIVAQGVQTVAALAEPASITIDTRCVARIRLCPCIAGIA